jgi:putative ABC transport system substrate-binding protein
MIKHPAATAFPLLSRRAVLVGSAAAAAGVVAPRMAFAQAAYSQWFKLVADVSKDWSVEEFPGDAMRVWIRARKARRPGILPKRVLVLYPRPSSAYDVTITKILNIFEDKDINAEFLALNFNLADERGHDALHLSEKGHFDLIFAMGSESTAWLWKHYRGGKLPVVSVCSKDPVILGQAAAYDKGSGTNLAFTSLNMPLDVQMAYLDQLRPNMKNLGILVDNKNLSAVETQSKPMLEYARARGVRVMELGVNDPSNAKPELERLVSDAVKAMQKNDFDLQSSLFWITGSTSVFKEIQTINANAFRVPVISAVPEIVGPGDDSAVLSIGISFESNAHLAAVYAADIIKSGRRPGELRVGIVSPPDIAINFRKAREIGMKIPFAFFESAGTIYDYDGRRVRPEETKPKGVSAG